MHLPTNRGLKLAAALIIFAMAAMVANQLRRPDSSTGLATVPGDPGAPSSAAALEVLKSQLKWDSALSLHTYEDKPFSGVAREFYPNGSPRLIWPFKDGKWHGLLEEFTEGRVRNVSKYYANGLRHGETRYWTNEGHLHKVVMYENDKEVSVTEFNQDGSPKS
jgi:hypothetical protein